MPIEAITRAQEPVAPQRCPTCGADPLRPFLRFQIIKSGWPALAEHWRAWRGGRPPRLWCVICWDCKEIVGYE